MAVLEQGIIFYLKAFGPLTALVGDRVYGMKIPQGATLPCVVVQRISTPRITAHDSSGAVGDLISPRFQFDAWAETQAVSKGINDAIRAALNGKRGSLGLDVKIGAGLNVDEVPEEDPETKLFRTRSDYMIWHTEQV